MLKKPIYSGDAGFFTLTEHMRHIQQERKSGAGAGYETDYFKGMLHGLNMLNAIGGDINTQLYDFVLRDQAFNQPPKTILAPPRTGMSHLLTHPEFKK